MPVLGAPKDTPGYKQLSGKKHRSHGAERAGDYGSMHPSIMTVFVPKGIILKLEESLGTPLT